MICPKCGKGKTHVLDTYIQGSTRKRWRECPCCGKRFATWEVSKEEWEAAKRAKTGIANYIRKTKPGYDKMRRRS